MKHLIKVTARWCREAHTGFVFAIALCAAVAMHRAMAAETDSNVLASGPKSLIITYNVAPADRVAFRKSIETTVAEQFQKWKEQGVVESYHLFFNRITETDTWDLVTLVTFARYTDIAKWNDIEKTSPGGLPIDVAKLTTAIRTTSMDLTRSGAVPKKGKGKSVFKLIPYSYNPDTPTYVAYLDTYVIPQVKGWQEEGVLASYGIFIARYQTERPWTVMFVYEYNDEESLGKREATMAKVRARLKDSNPEWNAASDKKLDIRTEHRIVLTEDLAR